MVKPGIQKTILNKFCANLSKDSDFAAAYIDIEKYLYTRCKITNGEILRYELPYNPNFNLSMQMRNGVLHLTVTNGEETVKMHSHNAYPELYALGQKITAILDKEHLTLAPLPDKDFIDEISQAEIGSVINFNNKTAVVCVKSDKDEKVFMKQFEGSLANIAINSFKNREKFVINTKEMKDLHYLYGKAYVGSTTTADIRITHDSYMGQHICSQVEQNLQISTSKTIHIGPLNITAVKDASGKTAWYDAENKHVDRETVSIIFGWAKQTIPEISIQEWASGDIGDGFNITDHADYNEFIAAVKEAAVLRDFTPIIESAFKHAKASNGTMTLSIDDLEQDDKGNFISTTFAFKQSESGQQIFKITYENNDFNGWPEEVKEISVKEFEDFCRAKFDESYRSIVNLNERVIAEKIQEGHSKDEVMTEIFTTLNKRESYNFMGISKEDLDNVSERVSLLLENMPTEKDKRVGFDEFMDLEELEDKDPSD